MNVLFMGGASDRVVVECLRNVCRMSVVAHESIPGRLFATSLQHFPPWTHTHTRVDKEVIDKLNKDIIEEENLDKHKPHVCQEPAYERDYSYLCPEDWIKNSNNQCWGIDYDGHCESLKYFQDYSAEEKKEFEMNCCVLWPKLKDEGMKRAHKKDLLRGSISSSNGLIIKPKYL
ncbi:hypothetical protein C922_00955 [Plasmodium inui San Antonio 1]|uniref:CPW-WPC domain-containing protein n=1 Tax=Plasmodium inui San Antonio 1 TaxID=1237626 RepID=W7ASZ1_9APIC|nr:hypothetical protein C922_00955 [Plasmodium inui San Antonio 1]EUD68556.1 hypothetical protein C922_00955 [Plasmodium inui San Antonio 1]